MSELRAQLQAAVGSAYTIERELGAGGMATVFLARDRKHDRDVAIKVLHPALARSLTGERFVREIALTARFNHPHILALLDSGASADADLVWYVMPVVTGESLRDRLRRDGALPIPEAMRFAAEVTEALAYAHARGVVHRDVKPENVLLSEGHAIVVDFGIAKALGEAREAEHLTMEGVSLGTPAYMAPEQAAGDADVDHRADVYAVGALLFEMLAGAAPFTGTWQQVTMEKLRADAPSLAPRCAAAPAALVALVARCLARDPAHRPQSADALLGELRTLAAPTDGPARARARTLLGVSAAAVAAVAVIASLWMRERRASAVHQTLIPTIDRLIEADQLDSAFALAVEVEHRAPGDSALERLWPLMSQTQTFLSEPAGAVVTRASLGDTTKWIPVGTTPTQPVRIPNNAWYYRYEKPGYRTITLMGARLGGSYVPIPSPVPLRKLSDPDTDMVQLRGAHLVGTLWGLSPTDTFDLADFLMDKREVTNRQYKAFVDAGGYTKRDWWDSTIVQNGKSIAFEAAMKLFVDKTGQPGPAMWEGGAPPKESEEFPVGGVSWYEARAYARFAGKELPTVVEWNAAAIPEAARWVVPSGRFESNGPVKGGAARSVSPRGVYDLAGNVREWAVNAREPGSRFILGGGWSDPQYLFNEIYAQPELDRSAINGIRLVRRLAPAKDLARASAPIVAAGRDFSNVKPADDATFRGYLAQYEYDHTPLNAKVVRRDTTNADWVREDVELDVPGGSSRLPVAFFLPKHAKPPYQTVVVFPASDALLLRDPRNLSMSYSDFIIRSGRALVYPIYEHTYGRATRNAIDDPDGSIAHRDQMLRWSREMRRAMDYASTRPEVDTTRFAYASTSWGSRLAPVMLAIEPRFKAAVLNVPGLRAAAYRPEEDPVNFLPRVKIPVLMLSGKYDSTFPFETSQKPFLRLLGSPGATKKQVVFDGGHFLPKPMMVQETLKWYDQYLGVVVR